MSLPGDKELSVDLLLKYPIFRDMSPSQVEEAAKYIHTVHFEAGRRIFSEGEEGDDVFLLLYGEVEITQQLTLFTSEEAAEQRDKSLIRLSEVQRPVIGEIAICARTPRSATVNATTKVTLGRFTAEDLQTVVEKDPHFGYLLYRNIASIIAGRLITANQNVLKLTTAFSLALQRGV